MKRTLALLGLVLLTACSTAPQGDGDEFTAQDPWVTVNRPIFSFNLAADSYLIRPVAKGYHYVLPQVARTSVGNFLQNLTEPTNVLNSSLQGDIQAAGTSLWRFLLNSTIGFAGLRDFAGENGLPYNKQNFSSTMASYGVARGPYVIIPLLGPSDARGTGGLVVDWFTDPVNWVFTPTESIAQGTVDAINTRDDESDIIDQFYYESIEPYSATRAAYLQHEAFQN